jgi:hypothetical protein
VPGHAALRHLTLTEELIDMTGEQKSRSTAYIFGAYALIALTLFLHALLVRDRFEIGYLLLSILMLTTSLLLLRR